jgi:hypothetical protein
MPAGAATDLKYPRRDESPIVPAVAFVNNHFAGFSPETLRQLAELLG